MAIKSKGAAQKFASCCECKISPGLEEGIAARERELPARLHPKTVKKPSAKPVKRARAKSAVEKGSRRAQTRLSPSHFERCTTNIF